MSKGNIFPSVKTMTLRQRMIFFLPVRRKKGEHKLCYPKAVSIDRKTPRKKLRQVYDSFSDICDHPKDMAPTIPQPPPQSLLQTHCTFATNEFEARPIINEHEALGTMGKGKKRKKCVFPLVVFAFSSALPFFKIGFWVE